jgi:hypothetical protein
MTALTQLWMQAQHSERDTFHHSICVGASEYHSDGIWLACFRTYDGDTAVVRLQGPIPRNRARPPLTPLEKS